MTTAPYLVILGGSAGGLQAILTILPQLDVKLQAAIIIVLHRQTHYESVLTELLSAKTMLRVKEAEEKEVLLPGVIYIAPADYHLLIEADHSLSLDYSEKVNFSRPSIDVTFEAAAAAYGCKLAAILLSGANSDGANGLAAVYAAGGITVVQDPESAEVDYMPRQALLMAPVEKVLLPEEVPVFINSFTGVDNRC
ncbi:chemotaxis protein CheB [Chitinophaga nivalis]|uniref:protein-glutamate methylesterase n=1 Tax=Chitinophaga nivalis TaxID=2991709 RepID=A0ABT3IWU4_9BACT|nr:chemotaxis protein CheB [Chitinophaga nivalis]MCW3461857.1 chemotaxis protein CheB [Chitinophaga nivalis]MCW3488452.1 chemotaxis protein CheB [Chitinophaga nivalis]